ncbi:alcohol dehydrogenase catalytic domain-containing protein [Nonomuraea sp. NPDC050022]|uniref:alcohol dehydrogenase catalytic domain-containing protein n=1 Tax=Nonomuraea sp. NPDC050022 TaxID=3364358 RepID=UPI0037B7B49F
MKAVVCTAFGKPVELVERPDPVAGPGQVVVEVEAAGVNYVDGLMVGGTYQLKPQLPFTPGYEVAGRLADGSRVLAITGLGGYATHVVISEEQAVPLPAGLDPGTAAAFAQSYCTAMYALRERARLRHGERVLVLGAGGGVDPVGANCRRRRCARCARAGGSWSSASPGAASRGCPPTRCCCVIGRWWEWIGARGR